MARNCKLCGRKLRDTRDNYCRECFQKIRYLPDDYLVHGYFDADGFIHPDLLTTTAELVAMAFGVGKPKLTNSQLRRFYSHALAAEEKLDMTGQYRSAEGSIQKLAAYAAEARGKSKVPETFYRFVEKNLAQVKDEKTFRRGFMEHFEAVVAYYYYLHPRN